MLITYAECLQKRLHHALEAIFCRHEALNSPQNPVSHHEMAIHHTTDADKQLAHRCRMRLGVVHVTNWCINNGFQSSG